MSYRVAQLAGVFVVALAAVFLPARAALAVDELDLSQIEVLDEEQLQKICQHLETKLRGEYILELAELRDFARELLAALEEIPEAQPYTAWLRSRLDYLEIAYDLRPPGLVPPPLQPSRPFQPSAVVVRKKWAERVNRAPVPATTAVLVERLKAIFRNEKVPVQLVWLAEVESSFNPRAISPSGAAGLFQIMPGTAKFLELSLWPFDQRLNPDRNARAAARYLRYLAGKFPDWRLILAAYNAGEGRVRRTLEKAQAKTFDEIALHLPAETQLYVPKVETTIQRREGVALPDLALPR